MQGTRRKAKGTKHKAQSTKHMTQGKTPLPLRGISPEGEKKLWRLDELYLYSGNYPPSQGGRGVKNKESN
jgi:hypothetical protein